MRKLSTSVSVSDDGSGALRPRLTYVREVRMGAGVFLACWALAACVALALGRDTSWDLRNYHYYNAWALLQGRWAIDLAPAAVYSFLHPALDIPFYLLTRSPLNA